jgi:hypothetical protein
MISQCCFAVETFSHFRKKSVFKPTDVQESLELCYPAAGPYQSRGEASWNGLDSTELGEGSLLTTV